MGSVHRDVTPSSPCMGTERGGATYTAERYGGQYAPFAGPGPASYTAGQSFEATIVLDADHNGEAQWQFCPHSQEETEECFRENPVSDWVDVHAYWDSSNQEDHWKSGEHFSQTVTLPSGVPAGPGTLRWFWVCKYTDEIFLSCIDVHCGEVRWPVCPLCWAGSGVLHSGPELRGYNRPGCRPQRGGTVAVLPAFAGRD